MWWMVKGKQLTWTVIFSRVLKKDMNVELMIVLGLTTDVCPSSHCAYGVSIVMPILDMRSRCCQVQYSRPIVQSRIGLLLNGVIGHRYHWFCLYRRFCRHPRWCRLLLYSRLHHFHHYDHMIIFIDHLFIILIPISLVFA